MEASRGDRVNQLVGLLALDRIWQWAWDRHSQRYSWAVFAVSFTLVSLELGTVALIIVAFEKSDQYVAAALAALTTSYLAVQPGRTPWRLIEEWGQSDSDGRLEALEATYTIARASVTRSVWSFGATSATLSVLVGAIVGASGPRLVEYGIIGVAAGIVALAPPVHGFIESCMRPARIAIAGASGVGDGLPRPRPSFATWSLVFLLSVIWTFTLVGALFAALTDGLQDHPVVAVTLATLVVLVFGIPLPATSSFGPLLQPIRDLDEGTKRVAAGDYSQRLPVVQDDDLGTLAASFNRMQAGLAERERLHSAFGSYVDPALAARLLEQGDDVFAGERREVTVMFVDIRNFTPFAEANTAEDTVSHLNALFEIVVPAVLTTGGHVNKYLGDGALAVFGAPNTLDHHADAAVAAALQIRDRVAEHFDGSIKIGIGINTGQVIAGTIGGAGKLEFTLIGDTVNVASRIEQLTKATGDTILMTQATLDALAEPPGSLIDQGTHAVKGKSGTVQVYGFA